MVRAPSSPDARSPDLGSPDPSLDEGLVLHLSFDRDDFASGTFADLSGHSNGADCQHALTLGNAFYDECPRPATGPDGSVAAQFSGTTCDMSSRYLGVKSAASFDHLSKGTLALWISYVDSTYRANKLLDTYQAFTPHTWMLGRDDTPYNIFRASDDHGMDVKLLALPDADLVDHQFGSWNHIAVTWDGSTIRGYYNGTPFAEVSQNRFLQFALGTYLAIGAENHGDPRYSPDNNCVNYYGGDPSKSYVQPNAGFLNGEMDDIRIYDRALAPAEVALLAQAPARRPTAILAVGTSGSGAGAVVDDQNAIGCGLYCAHAFAPGSVVKLTATADPDSMFSGWSGACSGSGSCQVTVDQDLHVTASFTQLASPLARFGATLGQIAAPFTVLGDVLVQPSDASDPLQAGRAAYSFTVTEPGDYFVIGEVDAPDWSSNSFFVNVDAEPTGDYMAWHIPITAGIQRRIVNWQGNGTSDMRQFDPKLFSLAAGSHTLIIRGREASTYLQSLVIAKHQ
jgi:hypothetical protein